jgi:hypothetical protein
MEVHPGEGKALTGALEARSGALDALIGKRCEHTGRLNMTVGWRSTPPLPHLWELCALKAPVEAIYAPVIYTAPCVMLLMRAASIYEGK